MKVEDLEDFEAMRGVVTGEKKSSKKIRYTNDMNDTTTSDAIGPGDLSDLTSSCKYRSIQKTHFYLTSSCVG